MFAICAALLYCVPWIIFTCACLNHIQPDGPIRGQTISSKNLPVLKHCQIQPESSFETFWKLRKHVPNRAGPPRVWCRGGSRNVEGCWGHQKEPLCAFLPLEGGPMRFSDATRGAPCPFLTLDGSSICFFDTRRRRGPPLVSEKHIGLCLVSEKHLGALSIIRKAHRAASWCQTST